MNHNEYKYFIAIFGKSNLLLDGFFLYRYKKEDKNYFHNVEHYNKNTNSWILSIAKKSVVLKKRTELSFCEVTIKKINKLEVFNIINNYECKYGTLFKKKEQ